MKKKEIRFYESFEQLDLEELRQNLDSSLEERWEKIWQLQKLYDSLFPAIPQADQSAVKRKRIIISKPEWI
jgi:hypothetical protein